MIPMERKVEINTENIKLDALLKYGGVAGTGGEAKMAIQDGSVTLNGSVETRRTKKIFPGDVVVYRGTRITVVRGNQEA
jgi:ribosome-associated protein